MRFRVWLFSAVFLFAAAAGAAEEGEAAPPFTTISVPDAKGKVLAFFSYTCSFCRSSHEKIASWGKTVPMKFEMVPVVVKDLGSVAGARAYYAVMDADARKEPAFSAAVYARIQDQGESPSDARTYLRAARDAGVSGFEAAWNKQTAKRAASAAVALALHRVVSTPSISVGGQFLISPENTAGDMDLFMQLASGMVSKVVAPKGRR